MATVTELEVIHHCAVRVKATDVPVSVGGITVEPGEIIHAGAEGGLRRGGEAARGEGDPREARFLEVTGAPRGDHAGGGKKQ